MHTVTSLVLSLAALMFVVWVALAHPAHRSVYGPYAHAGRAAAVAGRGASESDRGPSRG